MKPLKLTISAFASYADTHPPIDFTQLDAAHKPFVISGKTGCGKTTIFDAITFALYGKTSGDQKAAATLRCKTADPKTPTFVELEFGVHGSVYKIRRNPEYMRPALRGSGVTKEKASAELTLPDGKVLTKKVDDKIVEIIGLDAHQFRQVVLIAQGDFRSLLTANTDDRKKLFRKLFHTERFEKLQGSIRDKYNAADRDNKQAFDLLKNQLRQLTVPEQYADELEVYRQNILWENVAAIIELVQKGIDTDAQRLAELTVQLTGLDQQKSQLTAQYQSAKTLADNRAALTKALEDQGIETKAASKADEALHAVEKNKPEIENLQTRIATIMSRYDDYAQLSELIESAKQDLEASDELSTEAGASQKNAEALEEQIKSIREKANGIPEKSTASNDLGLRIQKLQDRLTALSDLRKLLTKFRNAELAYSQKRQATLQAQADEKDKHAAYTQMDAKFFRAQAGIMADRLEDNKPCPVCGSLHHPNPAQLEHDVPTEDEVKAARVAWNTAQTMASEAASEESKAEATRNEREDQVREQSRKLFGSYDPDQIDEQISSCTTAAQDEKRQAEIDKKELDRELDQLKQQQDSISELEQQQKEASQTASEKKQKAAGLKASSEQKQQNAAQLQQQLPFGDRKQAESEVQKLIAQKKELDDAITEATMAKKEADEKVSKLNGRIESLKEQIEASDPNLPSIEVIAEKQKALNETIGQFETEKTSVSNRHSANEKLLNDANNLRNNVFSTLAAIQLWKPIYDVANGKVDLETYVQMQYFDRVLILASQQMKNLSNGRYAFVRSDETDDGRRAYGLGLNVHDCRNGTERAVSSLSGGESFIAALSLALGMSDTITSGSAVRLDTLFIDEGFGSLDEESLGTAIKLLMNLSGGSRMVGVISHVEELKRRLGNCIEVVKDAEDCSHAKVKVE